MEDGLVTYFEGEKQGALLIAGVGVVAVALAVVLLQPRWELRSLAVTLGLVALGEIALGVGLYLRTGPQVTALLAQLGTEAARFLSDESARMARVQRSFVVVQYVEMAVIVVAAVGAFALKNRFWIAGIALALLCHGAFLLAFDLVAERRGAAYQAALEARAGVGSPRPPSRLPPVRGR